MNDINSAQIKYADQISDDLDADSSYREIVEMVYDLGGSYRDGHAVAIYLGREEPHPDSLDYPMGLAAERNWGDVYE